MKSLTVMCVDDDAGIRELCGALLSQNGYEFIAASNGLHALHVFETKENEIDAVILDYEMPGMNGLEPATWLKQRHPTLPVIMVSGSHPDLEQMAPFVDAAMGKVFHYSTSWTSFKSCLPLPEFLRHPPLVTFSDTVWAESPRSCRTYDKMPTNRL
jgi:CheY-like chemotaxis protein